MDAIILCLLVFFAGFFMGRRSDKQKSTNSRQNTSTVNESARPSKPYTPPKKFRDSRWEEKDELFWNMINGNINLRSKRSGYLLTEKENNYREKLESWFGRYCYVNSQVSLGQLIDFPEQDAFSEEERKRFFAIFNGMAMDYVLVSKKTNKIVCVIELNDKSHNEPERIERDRKLASLMKISGLPFISVSLGQIDVEPGIWAERENASPEFR